MIGNCWKVTRYSRKPEPIEIIRETEKTYTYLANSFFSNRIEERREAKRGNSIFSTWDETKAYMVSQAEDALEYAKQEVDRKRSALEVVKALKQ